MQTVFFRKTEKANWKMHQNFWRSDKNFRDVGFFLRTDGNRITRTFKGIGSVLLDSYLIANRTSTWRLYISRRTLLHAVKIVAGFYTVQCEHMKQVSCVYIRLFQISSAMFCQKLAKSEAIWRRCHKIKMETFSTEHGVHKACAYNSADRQRQVGRGIPPCQLDWRHARWTSPRPPGTLPAPPGSSSGTSALSGSLWMVESRCLRDTNVLRASESPCNEPPSCHTGNKVLSKYVCNKEGSKK